MLHRADIAQAAAMVGAAGHHAPGGPGGGAGQFSSTALHWLDPGDLVNVYRSLARLVRPRGLLRNAEHLLVGPPGKRLTSLTEQLRQRLVSNAAPTGGESWEAWWRAAPAEPAFADLLAERARAFEDHTHQQPIGAPFHEAALQQAGFSETAVVWRYLDDTIIGALR